MKTTETEARGILKRMMANGPLTALPRSRGDLAYLLALGAARFDPARNYSEAQVNELLQAWLAPFSSHYGVDHVTVRRCLVDAGLLVRDKSGASYRVAADRVSESAEDGARKLDPAAVMAQVRAERDARKRMVRA